MVLNMPRNRLDDRRVLLDSLDGLKRQAEAEAALDGVDQYKQQAFDLLLGSAADAFDLTKEDPGIVERYDTSRFRVGKKVFRDSQLGRHMLTARRLIEKGCGFVTVHSAGWDMHADGNNPGIHAGMEMLGRPVDRAVSAFLADLDGAGYAWTKCCWSSLAILAGRPRSTTAADATTGPTSARWPSRAEDLNTGQAIGQSAQEQRCAAHRTHRHGATPGHGDAHAV